LKYKIEALITVLYARVTSNNIYSVQDSILIYSITITHLVTMI